jgi:hypothetical protein
MASDLFDAFFHAATGHPPYDCQRHLATDTPPGAAGHRVCLRVAVTLLVVQKGCFAIDKLQRRGLFFRCYLLPAGPAARPPAGFCF